MSNNIDTSSLANINDENTEIDGNSKLTSLFATASGTISPILTQSEPLMLGHSAATLAHSPIATVMAPSAGAGLSMSMMASHPAHSHDPVKQLTHTALLDLVPAADATHIAINDGSWFDVNTWQNGQIPGDGSHVLIHEGISVTYDQKSDVRLQTIRVDGTLAFDAQVDTKIIVDTFVVAPAGELLIGSEDNPVSANVKTQILFTADGEISQSTDPTLLGRGLISHGKARIYGADKTEFLALQAEATAGDNVLVLKDVPQGWQVGDQIVLGGTAFRYGQSDENNARFQDEELTITRIEGQRVFFTNNDISTGNNTVLRFDHQLPDIAEQGQLDLYVANTTRNVTFETENAASVPTQQRAHVMFMHNPDVVVENAGFYNLGRTDKTKVVDDPGTNVDGTIGGGTNARGRYGLHFHRTGAEDITGTPAVARGNVVVGTPGWGIVHHDSNAVLANNVVFDVVGTGIVAESGNEIGVWRNNLTLKTTGVDYANIFGTEEERDLKFDLGFKGEGYWVQGAAQVAMIDNIAISANDAGISIFGDSLDPTRDFRDKETISIDLLPPSIRALVAAPGQTEVDVTDIPLRQLTGFQSYNTRDGILLWGHQTNFDGQLEFNSPTPTTAHNLRSTINDFAVWGVRGTGVKVQYSSKTDIKNGLIIGNPNNPRGIGLLENNGSFNIDFKSLTVKGFEKGLRLEPPNEDKDFIASSISNSYFSNNTYNLAPIGGAPLDGRLIDDFPKHFKIINTKFVTPEDNAAPVARFSTQLVGGLAVSFDAGASADLDPLKPEGKTLPAGFDSNAIAAYGWDLNNDGRIDQFGRQISHHFSQAGAKPVSLTVWDNQGATHTLIQTINVQPSQYINPFVDSNFSRSNSFEAGYKNSSLGTDLAWFATNGVRRVNGSALLSNPSEYGSSIAQVVQDNRIRKGKQTLGLKLKNTEGANQTNNDIEITLWGVNGEFKSSIFEKAAPYKVGTLPIQRVKLADITLGGESFDWQNFQWNIDLKNGYQFLLFQVNTKGTNGQGDYVGIDDVRLFGDGISTPIASLNPAGDNRYLLNGTATNNRLRGSDRNQVLDGDDGNDTLFGLGGNDSLLGGSGDDILFGNEGNDNLRGQEGNDDLSGGDGEDSLYGDNGDDVLKGWNGDDRLFGGMGQDRLYGSNGDDSLYGEDGDDSLYGNNGNDSLNGAQGDDYLEGWSGRDTLDGSQGNDTLLAGGDDDVLYGGLGEDELWGHNGNDWLNGGSGHDRLFGEAGNDTLYAGEGNDTLTGGSGNDSLDGSTGNDRLIGVDSLSLKAGFREQDILIDWAGGTDLFVLGDQSQVYYNDGRNNTLGAGDYAVIRGFKASDGDQIQLHGQASDYSLGAIPQGFDLQNGSGIYLNTPGADELVAIVAYVNNLNLNSDSFVYV
ncbi:MAG: G8 domain-containing protein [Thermosynechococcaceae cyanobacterium]